MATLVRALKRSDLTTEDSSVLQNIKNCEEFQQEDLKKIEQLVQKYLPNLLLDDTISSLANFSTKQILEVIDKTTDQKTKEQFSKMLCESYIQDVELLNLCYIDSHRFFIEHNSLEISDSYIRSLALSRIFHEN